MTLNNDVVFREPIKGLFGWRPLDLLNILLMGKSKNKVKDFCQQQLYCV